MYNHLYCSTKCPACGHDLTTPDKGVWIEFGEREQDNDTVPSHLDDGGELIDVDDIILQGWHKGTRCYACKAPLEDMEMFV